MENLRVVLDCRWLGPGGVGRVTELVLRDLQTHRPPWTLVLWGRPDRLAPFRDVGVIVPTDSDPKRQFGQIAAWSIPRGDVTIFFHQIRPLVPAPAVTFIHDTIPLRYGSGFVGTAAKRLFFRLAVLRSARILTVSEHSRRCLIRDVGAKPALVDVVELPVEGERFDRIATSRAASEISENMLFVGRFAPHKNLRRLANAFAQSKFAARGGRLELVGGSHSDRDDLERWIQDRGLQAVTTAGPCTEAELAERFATRRILAMPSIEEGFGLPAFEAAAVGMPVVCSRTGAMARLPEHIAAFCDPFSVQSIAAAIDEAAARNPRQQPHRTPGNVGEAILRAVTAAANQVG